MRKCKRNGLRSNSVVEICRMRRLALPSGMLRLSLMKCSRCKPAPATTDSRIIHRPCVPCLQKPESPLPAARAPVPLSVPDIQIAIVEVGLQFRHRSQYQHDPDRCCQLPQIGDFTRRHPRFQKFNRRQFSVRSPIVLALTRFTKAAAGMVRTFQSSINASCASD